MWQLFIGLGFWVATWLNTSAAPAQIATAAGTGQPGYSGDGGPALAAQINNPYGVVRGPDGALHFCDMDNHVIRKVTSDGSMMTLAGNGKRGYSGDGGPALQAQLNEPYEVRFDRNGNLWFVEMRNHIVRRVERKTGLIATVAGSGKEGFSGDGGPSTQATLKQPHSIQFDARGDLYICDIGNHRIRKVDRQTGLMTTFAGNGERGPISDGGKISAAPLNGPRALDFDRQGHLWLALREGNAVYELDLEKGTIHHRAGTGRMGFSGNGGPALQATLSGPKGLSIGPNGDVYLADTESHSIRMIDLEKGTLELIAGTGERGDGPDGDAWRCRFNRPHGIFVDADGTIFVGDSEAHRVRKISSASRRRQP